MQNSYETKINQIFWGWAKALVGLGLPFLIVLIITAPLTLGLLFLVFGMFIVLWVLLVPTAFLVWLACIIIAKKLDKIQSLRSTDGGLNDSNIVVVGSTSLLDEKQYKTELIALSNWCLMAGTVPILIACLLFVFRDNEWVNMTLSHGPLFVVCFALMGAFAMFLYWAIYIRSMAKKTDSPTPQ